MASSGHITLDRIGPHSDIGQVAYALAARTLSQEIGAHIKAVSDLMEWETGPLTKANKAGSIKAARRAVAKAEVRVSAAHRLVQIAEADMPKRATYPEPISVHAPQSSLTPRTADSMPRAAIETAIPSARL